MQPDPGRCGMILRNPPPLLPVVKRIAARYPLGRWLDPVVDTLCDSMNAALTASQVQLPAVFLQSELDTLVPVAHQDQVIRSYAGPRQVVVLEGLPHDGIATDAHVPLIRQSIDWLWQHSGCKSNEPFGV
jgi:alpha-beta hydrolase superfamily lysophospholipase